MKALVLDQFGDASAFRLAEIPRPEPGPGQVLIEVKAVGVNPADWKDREGHTAIFFDIQFPYVIGFDAAGIVADTGVGVAGLAPGDRVMTTTNHGKGEPGSYAEYVVADRDRVAKVPSGMALELAAALPLAGLTAWQALFDRDKGGLLPGQRVLVHGGSGGVGSFAVPLARWTDAKVACTCSAPNLEYARQRGGDPVVDYTLGQTTERILEWAPDGLDLIIDAVGAGSLPDPLALLKPGGRMVAIATLVADGDIAALRTSAEAAGKHYVLAILNDENCAAALERLAMLVSTGRVPAPEVETFTTAQVREVHNRIAGGHVRGKLVMHMDLSSAR
jgi:NADPH2:quinone reductase